MCFSEFIKMGFVDPNRVAIWGWVGHPDFVPVTGRKKKNMFYVILDNKKNHWNIKL